MILTEFCLRYSCVGIENKFICIVYARPKRAVCFAGNYQVPNWLNEQYDLIYPKTYRRYIFPVRIKYFGTKIVSNLNKISISISPEYDIIRIGLSGAISRKRQPELGESKYVKLFPWGRNCLRKLFSELFDFKQKEVVFSVSRGTRETRRPYFIMRNILTLHLCAEKPTRTLRTSRCNWIKNVVK